MRASDWGLAIAICILLAGSGLLALAETALVRTSRAKAMALREDGRRGAEQLVALVERPERFLNPVLLCVLICQLISATLIGVLAAHLFGGLGVAIATVFEVVVIFVVFEALPKNWAVHNPERAALGSAPVVSALVAFPPVRWLSKLLIGLANVAIGRAHDAEATSFVTESELLALADVAQAEDVIEPQERAFIHSVIEFGDTVLREVMVPRPDMVTLDAVQPVAEALREALEAGFSRLPVCEANVDEVVGVAFTKDLIRAEHDGRGADPVRDHVRPARFEPETKRLGAVLREMQAEHSHLAIVVDEYGSTAGLVTLEDVLEELVGDIADEDDREEPEVVRRADGSLIVAGRMNLDEVADLLGIDLPEGAWDTIGGLLLDLCGSVPRQGEAVELPGVRIIAERVSSRRIVTVKLEPQSGASEGG